MRKLAFLLLISPSFSVQSFGQDFVATAPRAEITLNGNWQYQFNQAQTPIPTSGWSVARVPAVPISDGTSSVWYQQTVWILASWNQPGRRFFIELEKCGHYCAVYLNGQPATVANGVSGENDSYSQFSPLVAEVTGLLTFGANNLVQIYVHNSDATHAARGVTLDQTLCPASLPNCDALAFQAATNTVGQRNWIGLVGDVSLFWRPAAYISAVSTVTSVRNGTMTAIVSVNGTGAMTAQATVYDGATAVLTLPGQSLMNGSATLEATWINPTLWGPAPYGSPHLYTLQVQLLKGGSTVDTAYSTFGFREVWTSGKTVYLNGLPLWMSGGFMQKLDPIRYVNDRRPGALWLFILQRSGMNLIQEHWDDVGEALYQLADEMGMLIVAAFYCNGAAPGQDQLDPANVTAWTDWMEANTAAWAQAVGNHPSVIGWRPIDVPPPNAAGQPAISEPTIYADLGAVVSANDPSGRPIFDAVGTDPGYWTQFISPITNQQICTTDSAFVSALQASGVPIWDKELAGTFALTCAPGFVSSFYTDGHTNGAVGVTLQLPSLFTTSHFTPSWFSISGLGNRSSQAADLPNWATRAWTPSAWSTEMAGLDPTPLNGYSSQSGDYQTTGLTGATANSAACLTPSNGLGEPVCVLVAQDGSGTAWFVTPWTGASELVYTNGQDVIENVTVSAPAPF